MNVSPTTDRKVPSETALIAWRHVGDIVVCIGITVVLYWLGSNFYNWAQEPWYYFNNVPVFAHPVLEWYVSVPFIVLGSILASQSRKRLRYWHRWVESGEIVDKDIEYHGQHSVAYVVYVRGRTRAGDTRDYGHSMTHGQYEQKRIGEQFSISE